MDLTGMKRSELQALCMRHGLNAGGTKHSLIARLEAEFSRQELQAVCMRHGLPTDGTIATLAARIATAFSVSEKSCSRSPVVVPKKTGKSAQVAIDSAAAAEDGISAELTPNVPVRRSRRLSMSAAQQEREAVAVEGVAAASAKLGASARVTRRSSLAGPLAAALFPASVEKKRGSFCNKLAAAEKKIGNDSNKLAAGSSKICLTPAVQKKRDNGVGVSARVTRRSSLAGAATVFPAAVEKKRGRGKVAEVAVEKNPGANIRRSMRK